MFKRNLWKIILSAVILVWALSELLPLNDTPFATYVRANATVKTAKKNTDGTWQIIEESN